MSERGTDPGEQVVTGMQNSPALTDLAALVPGMTAERFAEYLERFRSGPAGEGPVKVPADQAARAVIQDGDQSWRRYQVSYPQACTKYWEMKRNLPTPYAVIARVHRIMTEGLDRDPGPRPYTTLRQRDPAAPNGFWPWMADTRVEIREHMPLFDAVREAAPNSTVLINGLGLGVALHGVLLNPNIAQVDVLEINPELVELLRPHFDPGRVSFHIGDAHTYGFARAKSWDYAWHDIWPDISSRNGDSVMKLWRLYEHRVAWQDAWQRDGHLLN